MIERKKYTDAYERRRNNKKKSRKKKESWIGKKGIERVFTKKREGNKKRRARGRN